MIEETFTVLAEKGIHMNPATSISQLAFQNDHIDIHLVKGERVANATSVMSILGLELSHGSSVKVTLSEDNKEVMQHIRDVLEGRRFYHESSE